MGTSGWTEKVSPPIYFCVPIVPSNVSISSGTDFGICRGASSRLSGALKTSEWSTYRATSSFSIKLSPYHWQDQICGLTPLNRRSLLVLWSACFFRIDMSVKFDLDVDMDVDIIWVSKSNETLAEKKKTVKKFFFFSGYTRIGLHYKLTLIPIHFAIIWTLMI